MRRPRGLRGIAVPVAAVVLLGWVVSMGSDVSREEIRALLSDARYQEAEEAALSLLKNVEAESGLRSLRAAEVLDILVEARWRGGKAGEPETLNLAERAIKMKEAIVGREHASVATSLKNLGVMRYKTGDLDGARPLFERALAIQEKTLGSEHPETAKTLNNLGVLLYDNGQYGRARPILERALAIREKILGADHPDVAKVLDSLGSLLRDTGDYIATRSAFERSLKIKRKTLRPDHPDLAKALDNLANLFYTTGDYRSARPLYEEALAIREKGPNRIELAIGLSNHAGILIKIGDRAGAKRDCERALEIRETTLGPDHLDVAASLSHLADLYLEEGDSAKAKELYDRALAIAERKVGRDHPDVAVFLLGLASIAARVNDVAGARQYYERALSVTEKALGPHHPEVAAVLQNQADFLASGGDRKGALDAALRAEAIARGHFRLTARALSERESLRYAAVRASGLDAAIALAAGGLDPASRRRVWDGLIRSRALVLDEMSARRRALGRSADPGVARLAGSLRSAREELANLVVSGPGEDSPERYRSQVEAAHARAERAEHALAAKSGAFRRGRAKEQVGLAEVASALPADSALLAFARFTDRESVPRYAAFVLSSAKAEPEVIALGSVDGVESLFARWSREAARGALAPDGAAADAEASYRGAGEALRRFVWDPVAPRLRGVRRVFIVPDGALNLLSFGALPAEDGGYLVESGPLIHYLSAERDLTAAGTDGSGVAGKRAAGLLAVGGPAFDERSLFAALAPLARPVAGGDSRTGAASRTRVAAASGSSPVAFRGDQAACGSFQSIVFKTLPASEREVREVAALWKKSGRPIVELTGAAASERAFKTKAPGRGVLHLATHGFFLGGKCRSALESTRGIGGLKPAEENGASQVTGENPLLLSGLAFAGANHRAAAGPGEDDGILTAEEIATLDLRGVGWAVLSACDTGAGEVKAGEGVFGLRRAFQVAGARTVIMSLWAVEDEAARAWMKALYEARLLRGLATAEAVREASLTVLRHRRARGESTHPFFWAGFVAAGDWR